MAVIAAPPPPDPPAVSAALTETDVTVTSGCRGARIIVDTAASTYRASAQVNG